MRRPVLFLLALALAGSSCGGGDGAACTELREPEDPASTLHVLDPEGVTWQTDPPTSGPHLSAPTPAGVMRNPLGNAMQVTILEGGGALVQYEPGVADADLALLEGLAGDGTVVTPGQDLPAPVVATAWTWKLTCESVDFEALAEFVAVRPADAPGRD